VKKLLVCCCVVLCAFAARVASATPQPDAWILEDINEFQAKTWRYQHLMGVRKTAPAEVHYARHTIGYKLWVRSLWRGRAQSATRKFHAGPAHKRQWQCIHRYEGAWKARTGNGYYGGLQMDVHFMRMYGALLLRTKGTADRWTPLEQMWVAEKAYRAGRGFYPWPNTARACGLI
jgi:hypothetical protein